MLRVYEGSSEAFGQEAGREVLYENTGLFANILPQASRAIFPDIESWQDFEKTDFKELDPRSGGRDGCIAFTDSLWPARPFTGRRK